MMVSRIRKSQGFTLLEVLVAMAILALSYGMILQLLGSSAQKASRAAEYRQALMIAESQLNLAATVRDPAVIPQQGQIDDRFYWRLSLEPVAPLGDTALPSMYKPLMATVEVTWDDSGQRARSIEISTIRHTMGKLR